MRCNWDSMAWELNVGRLPGSAKMSRCGTTLTRPLSVSSHAGTWSAVTM